MAITFEKADDELILVYTPAFGVDEITKRLSIKDGVQIKHTFL